MSFKSPFLPMLALLPLIAACAKPEAFVEIPDLGKLGRSKATYERVTVCFSDGDRLEKIQRLADEECAKAQKKAIYLGHMRWQCRLTVPHQASFVCLSQDQEPGDRKQYLPNQGTGLPTVEKPDNGEDFFKTFGIGK